MKPLKTLDPGLRRDDEWETPLSNPSTLSAQDEVRKASTLPTVIPAQAGIHARIPGSIAYANASEEAFLNALA